MRLEARQHAGLVDAHEPAVADHVGGQDRRQPALDLRRLHQHSLSCAATIPEMRAARSGA
jgi:hypothetical protein